MSFKNNDRNDVNYIDSSGNALHPPLYCRICDVLMMFMLNGKFANKYFCGMCGMTEDPEESEFYAKHGDQLRSLDDDDDSCNSNNGNIIGSKYDEMIVQSRGDYSSSSFSQASERQPQMTNQRRKQSSTYGLPQNENNDDDWAAKELRRDLEANGIRQVVRIMDNIDDITITTDDEKYHNKINRIERPR
jgi:hypothetical protein